MSLSPSDQSKEPYWVKICLKELFLARLEHHSLDVAEFAKRTERSHDCAIEVLSELVKLGYATETQEAPPAKLGRKGAHPSPMMPRFSLSEKGRSRLGIVMTGGVFDILHVGHLASFEEARSLGDLLIVVVARDVTVQRLRHRAPVNNELDRMKLVHALSVVDLAVLGDENDFFSTVEKLDPDLIAIGYDQKHGITQLRKGLSLRRLHAKVVRLRSHIPRMKSSKILSKIQEVNSL